MQADKAALVASVENIERNSQAASAEFGKLHLKYQSLEAKRNQFQLSVEDLNKEKSRLESKVTKLEE